MKTAISNKNSYLTREISATVSEPSNYGYRMMNIELSKAFPSLPYKIYMDSLM